MEGKPMMATDKSRRSVPRKQQTSVREFAETVRDAFSAYRAFTVLTGRKANAGLRKTFEILKRVALGAAQSVKIGNKSHTKLGNAVRLAKGITTDLEAQFNDFVEKGVTEIADILKKVEKETPVLFKKHETEIVRLQTELRAAINADPNYHEQIIEEYQASRRQAIGLLRSVDAFKITERARQSQEREISIATELETEINDFSFAD